MTRRKSLKRRVRARMARTGESYTTARRHIVSRAEAESPRSEGRTTWRAGRAPGGRRRIWIAAAGLALVGVAVAAVVIAAGGDRRTDTEDRYAGMTPATPRALPPSAERVPCSEVLRPALRATNPPGPCFELRGRRQRGTGAISVAAIRRMCHGAPSYTPNGPCAIHLPHGQGSLLQVEPPSG